MQINTSRGMTRRRKIHRTEHYFGPNRQEMTCLYCSKTMSAMKILVVHIESHPQGGSRHIEIRTQIHTQDTPRDKWGKILLQMKGNIHEVQIQGKKYTPQPKDKCYTKASDRMKKREEERRRTKEEQPRNNLAKDKTTYTSAERTWRKEIREGGNEDGNNKEETTHSVFITITTPKEPTPQPQLTQKKKARDHN